MKKILFLAVAFCFFSSVSYAQTATDKSLDELFALTDMDKLVNSAYDQMDGMYAQMAGQMELTEAQKPIVDKFFQKNSALVREELSWKKLKSPMMETYRKVFSEPEVRELIEFYQSPLGKKLLEKMPELMQASMALMQDAMRDMMPKLQQLQQQLQQELEAAK